MNKALLIAVLFFLGGTARAEGWSDLKPGLSQHVALQAVGAPLIVTKSKSGLQVTWTYDCGGYIMFEAGLVRFWNPPRPKKP